jgi:hypothetical protein
MFRNILFFVLIFVYVQNVQSQSQNHPVSGTRYAPVYFASDGVFDGWAGADGTYITKDGRFFDSVDFNGIEVKTGPCIYSVVVGAETYLVEHFKVGTTIYPVNGDGLPVIVTPPYVPPTEYVFENPDAENYPMPPSGKDENGQFTQRIFFHVYPSAYVNVITSRENHLNSTGALGSSTSTSIYYGAGPCATYVSFLDYIATCQTIKVEFVTDKSEMCGKDGYEFLSYVFCTPNHSYAKPLIQFSSLEAVAKFILNFCKIAFDICF